MAEIRTNIELAEPSNLRPNASVEVVLNYINQNNNMTHSVGTVTLSPTWDLSREINLQVDEIIGTQRATRMAATVETPRGLGGRHGFDIFFDVKAVTDTGEEHTQYRKTVEPITLPVVGARHFQAIVCTAGEGEPPQPVRQVIQNWGFDIYFANDIQEINDRLTAFDDSPTLVVGILTTEATEAGTQLISNAAWATTETNALSLTFAETGVSLPELPETSYELKCDLTNYRDLLDVTGPALINYRQALETGHTSWLDKVVQLGKNEAKEALRALAYSLFFTSTGAPDAILDSIEVPDEVATGRHQPGREKSWLMCRANSSQTWYAPQKQAPEGHIEVKWIHSLEESVYGSPAVSDNLVFIVTKGGSAEGGRCYGIDANTGTEVWSTKKFDSVNSPATTNGRVFVRMGNYGNPDRLYALDIYTGKKLWSFSPDRILSGHPVLTDDTVYIGSHGVNSIHAVNIKDGQEIWRADVNAEASGFAINNNVVYVGNGIGTVYAIAARTGDVVWKNDVCRGALHDIAVANNFIYTGSGELICLDTTTGQKQWESDPGFSIRTFAVDNDRVYVTSRESGKLLILDANSGEKLWENTMGSYVSSPVMTSSLLLLGTGDGIYTIDPKNYEQNLISKKQIKSPVIVDRTLYAGNRENELLSLH